MMYSALLIVLLLALFILFKNHINQAKYAGQYIVEEPSPFTTEQKHLIRSSWKRVLPIKEQVAKLFYTRLFELDPSVKSLFKGRLDFQGDKLMMTLNVVVSSLDDLSEVESILQAMGKRHIIYSVEAIHYEAAGAALIWALREGLGESFSEQEQKAWVIAYAMIATTMKAEAYSA